MIDNSKKSRIVIIGAGFGGAYTAKYLRKKLGDHADIELINSNNYFVFQPLLPEVASGTINAQDAVTPLRLMLPGVRFRMAEVRDIDFEQQTVSLVQGSRRRLLKTSYDHLVIATGQETNLSFLPGFKQHSMTLKNLADAHELRNQVIQRLEHADVTQDETLRKRLLTFVVAGGGFSGVETIGEMSEMVRRVSKYYPNASQCGIRQVLVQRGNRILPELPEQLATYAQRQLEKRGIEVMLNTGLKSASATAVQLDDGEVIETATLVSTIGSGPSPLILSLKEKNCLQLQYGKIVCNRKIQVVGYNNVWSVGDVALLPLTDKAEEVSDYAPPTAQYAVREASCLANNITASIKQQKLENFTYTPRGSLASIGNYKAVATVYGMRFSGVLAWSMWRGFYMLKLPGTITKIRVALNWFLDYFVPRTIVQVKTQTNHASRYMCYSAGDTIFTSGQIADGFYTVISGKLLSTYNDPTTGKSVETTLSAGEHWGSSFLDNNLEIVGELKATTDAEVLILEREDFNAVRAAMPVVEDYLLNHQSGEPN